MTTQKIICLFAFVTILLLGASSCEKSLTKLDTTNAKLDVSYSAIKNDWAGIDSTTGKTTKFTTYNILPLKGIVSMPVKYIIEMDLKSNNFASPFPIISLTGIQRDTAITIFVSQINTALLANYYASIGQAYPIVIRARAMVTNNVGTALDTIIQSLGDYTVGITYDDPKALGAYPHISIPGGFTVGAWDPANPNRRMYSLSNNDVYQGFVDIDADAVSAGVKLAINDSWAVSYGEPASGALTGSLTSTNGKDIKFSTPGYYFLSADIGKLTYIATQFSAFQITGLASGNVDMTAISENGDGSIYGTLWEAKVNVSATDKIKFEIANTKSIVGKIESFVLGAPFASSTGGTRLKENGEPLTVGSSGTKTITLDLRKGLYHCTIK